MATYLMTRPFCWYHVQGHLSRSRSNIKATVKKNGRCGGIGVSQTHHVVLKADDYNAVYLPMLGIQH